MSLKLLSPAGGSVTLDAPSTASDYTIIMPPANGNTLVTPLPAGTSSQAPLVFTSGTALTTPVTGAMEYDGTSLYYTPIGTQRGIVPGMQFYMSGGVVGQNSTANQSLLGVGATLSSNTFYCFEGWFFLFKDAGTTSHNVRLFIDGTVIADSIGYIVYSTQSTSTSNIAPKSSILASQKLTTAPTTAVAINDSIATAAPRHWITLSGFIKVTEGGTFTPSYSLSAAPGGAYTVGSGSYLSIWPVSKGGNNTVSVGAWA